MAVTTAPRPSAAGDAVRKALTGRGADVTGLVFQAFLLLSLLISLALLAWLIGSVTEAGVSVLLDRPGDFLTGRLTSSAETTGIGQGIKGSFVILGFVAVLAFPIGVGAAIYLEEYAPDNRFTRFVDLNIRNLAGVPSVVYGLLGLAIFVNALRSLTGPAPTNGRSLLTAGLTLAILVLPIVIITAAEALRAVPDSIREAGFGVGATRWEVTRHHVLPYAAPGILTGTVLAFSRALGEAAPLIVIGAVDGLLAQRDGLTALEQLRGRFTALPMQVYAFTREADPGYVPLISATILVLLIVLLTANTAAILLRNHYEKKR